MHTVELLQHFRTHAAPLGLSRGGAPEWDDAELHRAAYAADPEGYLLLALVPGVLPEQRARVLLQALSASRAGVGEETRRVLDKVTRAVLFDLPPGPVLTVLLALRRLRVNHKHSTRAVLTFVLDHPQADTLIDARRPTLVDCFEHALGRATARGCARRIAQGETDSGYLRRNLLRFSANPGQAAARVAALYGPGVPGVGTPHAGVAPLDPVREREQVVTVTNRGDIAATLVHLYRGGPEAELRPALGRYVAEVTAGLPPMPGYVALVADTSESMRGYGDREWALLSQATALRLVLAEVCPRLSVFETGGPEPTDLAGGLLDALATEPELVVLVTDGYENRLSGDLARVLATLPRIGVRTPIVLCRSMFTGRDEMTLRDPAPGLPRLDFWHQDDFAGLLPALFAHTAAGRDWINAAMRHRLDRRRQGAQL
ncbi:hypothetical protein [Nocardia sp. alder85J]|uniref:hypothetical protein n=1 Tax=Nocardia sp. alder85J TaxID=2862949 RepID=UPI001CD58DE5|nr:hypothetical protein [Nocardia sp. alder85J]MCX4092339.1 hypothetical protein [Nocardia sp. alder85J]